MALVKNIPHWKLKPIFEGSEILSPLVQLEGPIAEESPQFYQDNVAAHIISTYPFVSSKDNGTHTYLTVQRWNVQEIQYATILCYADINEVALLL